MSAAASATATAPEHRVGARITFLYNDERGSAAAELTLLTPLLIILLLFVVLCGRLVDTRLRLDDAAHQAARSASLARSPSQADADARSTADAALSSAGVTCESLAVSTDTQGLRPGATITVTVSCSVGLSDLTLLDIPGSKTIESTFSSIVDVYRGTTVTLSDAGGDR
jgi:Flp pilus assembly protein TadG